MAGPNTCVFHKDRIGTLVAEGKETVISIAKAMLWNAASSPTSPSSTPGRPIAKVIRLPQNGAQFQPGDGDAGRVTVAEVENLVEPGAIDPDHIHTPGIFVDRIIHAIS